MSIKNAGIKAVIILLSIFLLGGCSNANKAEKAVHSFVKEHIKDVKSGVKEYKKTENTQEDGMEKGFLKFSQMYLESFDYKILSVKAIDNENVVVNTEVTAISVGDVFAELLKSFFAVGFENLFNPPSDEEMDKIMDEKALEIFSKEDRESVVNEAAINVKKIEGKWTVQNDENLGEIFLMGGAGEQLDSIGENKSLDK